MNAHLPNDSRRLCISTFLISTSPADRPGCFRRTWQASWYSFIEGAKLPAKHRNKVYHGDSSTHTHTPKKQRRIKIKYMSETFHFMWKVPFFAVAHDGAQQCGQCTQKDLNLHIKTITEKKETYSIAFFVSALRIPGTRAFLIISIFILLALQLLFGIRLYRIQTTRVPRRCPASFVWFLLPSTVVYVCNFIHCWRCVSWIYCRSDGRRLCYMFDEHLAPVFIKMAWWREMNMLIPTSCTQAAEYLKCWFSLKCWCCSAVNNLK